MMKEEKTTIMIAAAAVMFRPVISWPILIAAWLSRRYSHSSCMRLTRKTS
jgi:hypothetical protein